MAGKGALDYQVSLRGRGLSAMSHEAMAEMIDRYLMEGEPPPEGIKITIMVWRDGRSLDWQAANPAAKNLRGILRRLLQDGKVEIRKAP